MSIGAASSIVATGSSPACGLGGKKGGGSANSWYADQPVSPAPSTSSPTPQPISAKASSLVSAFAPLSGDAQLRVSVASNVVLLPAVTATSSRCTVLKPPPSIVTLR